MLKSKIVKFGYSVITRYAYRVSMLYLLLCAYSISTENKMAPFGSHFLCAFTQKHLIDIYRKELYPHDAQHCLRELLVHIWYPQESENDISSNQEKPYPLLVFSHGLGGTFNGLSYTALCRYCACQGYIVVSISHTYACKPSAFPDGRLVEYLFPIPALHYHQGDCFSRELETWIADVEYVLDVCELYNNANDFVLYQKIDMLRVGVMGHSFGGATAVQVCRRDARVKAAINLDGPLYGVHAACTFSRPVLFMVGQFQAPEIDFFVPQPAQLVHALVWAQHMNTMLLPTINHFIQNSTADVYKVLISGIVHATFSDEAFVVDPVMQPWLRDEVQAQNIIQTGVVAFFDQYLRNQLDSFLVWSKKDWPGVTVKKNDI